MLMLLIAAWKQTESPLPRPETPPYQNHPLGLPPQVMPHQALRIMTPGNYYTKLLYMNNPSHFFIYHINSYATYALDRSNATPSLLRDEYESVSTFMKDVLERVNNTFDLDQFVTNPDIDLNFQPTPSENAEIESFTSGSVSRGDMSNDRLSAVAGE